MTISKVIVLTQNDQLVERLCRCGIVEPITQIKTTKSLTVDKEYSFVFLVDASLAVYAADIAYANAIKILIVADEKSLLNNLLHKFDDYISLSNSNEIITLRINTYIKTTFQSESLTNNQNKYKQLVEQSGDTVILTDEQGYITEINSHVISVSLYDEQDLLENHISKIFPEKKFYKQLAQYAETNMLIETSLKNKNSEQHAKEIRVSKIVVNQNLFFLIIARDISERKKSLQRLKDSELRFRTLIEHSPNGMVIFKDDTISFINLVGLEILGGTFEDYIDQSFLRFISPSNRLLFEEIIHNAQKNKISSSEKLTCIDMQQNEISVRLSCVPIIIRNDVHYCVMFQDVTEEEQTKFDLKNKDLHISQIQKVAKVGHWENNLLKDNLYWSDEVYKIYNVNSRTFVPSYERVVQFIHPKERDYVIKAYKTSIENREPFEITYRVVLKGDVVKYVNEKCSTIYSPEGEPLRSLGTIMDVTQTITTEKALRQTEEKFQVLFDALDEPFLICAPLKNEAGDCIDFAINELNPACKSLFKTNYREIKGNTISEIFHDPVFWISMYKKVYLHGQTLTFRKYSKDLNRHFNVVLFPVTSQKQIAGIFTDISQKVYSENLLEQLTNRLQKIQEYARIGFYDMHLVTRKSMWSTVMLQIFEYDATIKTSYDLYLQRIHPDDKEMVREIYSDSIKKRRLYFSFEFRLLFPDGRQKHIYTEFHNTFEGKTCIKTEGWLQDISGRKQVEAELLDSETKFRRIFEIENDSLFLADCESGDILEVNDAAISLFKYSRKELLQKSFIELSKDPLRMLDCVTNERDRVDIDFIITREGNECPVEISFAYFAWQGRNVFLAAVRDVSRRREAELELRNAKDKAEESDKLKSSFLANMSHEIRTPLNAIVGFSRLLARKNYDENKRKVFLDTIQSNANQLLAIISDILDISKIESGQFILHQAEVNVNKLTRMLYETLELATKEKELELVCENSLSDADASIIGDEVRLKQVLSNLLYNAVKFTHTGTISFGYSIMQNKKVLFYVRDTGIGIAAEKHHIIFEHFRQEDDTTTRKYGGTGLGLSISKKLIELMGGTIWLESEKNKGATFYFTIPYVPVLPKEGVESQAGMQISVLPKFNGETILVVDDVESSYVYISEMLSDENVVILQAKSGQEAIDIFNTNTNIRLVLMDIQMSGMSGVETMRYIKSKNTNISIVAQTAFAQKGDKERFMKEGFDDYITKPLQESDLLDVFTKFLGK